MEKIALIVSKTDIAAQLILEKINEIGFPGWAVLYTFEEDSIHVDASKIKESKMVFLSRHASAAGTKSLTVHHIGNYGKALYGGEDKLLSGTLPILCANYLRALEKKCNSSELSAKGFSVCLEVTHHGPLIEKGVLFIEVGGTENEWKNEAAAKVIAETVIEETEKSFTLEQNNTIVVGLGGGHYAPDFTKLILRQPYAFGHICPKYALGELDEDLLKQMIEKSGAKEIILDWKGLKENKEKVVKLCEATGLPIKRVQNLLGHKS
ncbi:MAG: D-aminoacyl-tRNA deacylase [archaeon]